MSFSDIVNVLPLAIGDSSRGKLLGGLANGESGKNNDLSLAMTQFIANSRLIN